MKLEIELRPCLVDGKKALFHKWLDYQKPVAASWLVGGDPGGQLSYTLGIVELEDGQVQQVNPSIIRFIDEKIKQYYFDELPNEMEKV